MTNNQPPMTNDEDSTLNPSASLPWFRSLRQTVVFGLLAFSLLTFALALLLISASVRNDIALSEATLSALQDEVLRLSTPSAEVQALTTTLSNTRALADQLAAAAPPPGANWPAVIAIIDRYDPAAITLTSLTQTDTLITLSGKASNSSVAVEYASMLDRSGFFKSVTTQSVKLAVPAAAATTTPPVSGATETVEFVFILELST